MIMEEKLTKEELARLGKSYNSKLQMDIFKKIDGVIYKLCTKCLQYKPLDSNNFPGRSNVICGFGSHCIECEKKKEKTRKRVIPFNEKGELYCLRCKQYKPLSEFYENSSTTKNRNFYSNNCKQCESERNKEKRERLKSDDKVKFFKNLATQCRGRAYRSKTYECNITGEDLLELYEKQNHKCALSGIEMTTLTQKGKCLNNASVDRIVAGGDYSKNNIRLVCNHVNMMRSNLSDKDLINYCKAILNNYDNLVKEG